MSPDRRTLLAALGAGLTTGLLAGPALAQTSPAPAPAAGAPQRLTVLLDWFVNPGHAPLVIAQARGFFRDAGLDVTLVPPADPAAPPRLVAARQGDIAISYQPNLYLQVRENLPLVRVGTLIATPLNCLVALRDGPVKSIADLRGRTVGFSIGGFEDALLGTMLRSAGLTLRDVRTVNVNFALSQSLLAGRVDAVIGAFRNFEVTQLRLEGREGVAFYPEEFGVPPYDELIYVTRQDMAGDPRVRRFLDAVERATIAILNDPEGSWRQFIGAHRNLDDRLNRQAWLDSLPRFAHAPAALDPRKYTRFAEFMRAQGLIERIEPLERYAPMPG